MRLSWITVLLLFQTTFGDSILKTADQENDLEARWNLTESEYEKLEFESCFHYEMPVGCFCDSTSTYTVR